MKNRPRNSAATLRDRSRVSVCLFAWLWNVFERKSICETVYACLMSTRFCSILRRSFADNDLFAPAKGLLVCQATVFRKLGEVTKFFSRGKEIKT